MAVTLELNSAAIAADLNLNAAEAAGIRMSTWNQAVATPVYGGQPGPVKETMDLMVEGASHNALAASMQALDAYRVQAAKYMGNRTTEDPVWLECKMDDETGARRALVISIDEGYRLPLYAEHTGPPQDTSEFRLTVWRMPWWEDVAVSALPTATPAAAASVVYDYTAMADIVGDVGARLNCLQAMPYINDTTLDRLWMGIRAGHDHGTVANFLPIWECEDGTNGTDAADVVDVTASGGDKVTVTPGTATWAKRMSIQLSQVTANTADNLGLFLWLLRAAVSAGTWELQLRWGYIGMDDDDFVRGPIVETDNASWDYLEMGVQPIGLRNMQIITAAVVPATAETYFAVQVWARRTVGAGTIDLDCLCPIPLDQGWLVASSLDAYNAPAPNDPQDYASYSVAPTGQRAMCTFSIPVPLGAVYMKELPVINTDGLYLPPGDGRLIVVYARAASSDIADRIVIGSLQPIMQGYFERWVSLRGAE